MGVGFYRAADANKASKKSSESKKMKKKKSEVDVDVDRQNQNDQYQTLGDSTSAAPSTSYNPNPVVRSPTNRSLVWIQWIWWMSNVRWMMMDWMAE